MSLRFVALLRGVNVGGKNKLPMKDLVAMFVEAGCGGVRNYIQSGNVIFRAEPHLADRIPALIASQIEKSFGFRTPVLLRTVEQLEDVVGNNPFLPMGASEEALHVMFLDDLPAPDRVADLDPDRSPPDSFIVRGREVYLQLPDGVARSKLTNSYFDSKLKTTSTARNWRTVKKLLEMMSGDGL